MYLSYQSEKLTNAVRALAILSGSIQSRLENAFLAAHTLDVHQFPESEPEMCESWDEIRARLNAVAASQPEDGTLQATLREMDNDEAEEIAKMIVDLYFEVESARRERREAELRGA